MRKVLYLILTGIAIVILLAPGKGSYSWQKISDCLDDVKNKTKDTLNNWMGAAKNMAEEGKTEAVKTVNERL